MKEVSLRELVEGKKVALMDLTQALAQSFQDARPSDLLVRTREWNADPIRKNDILLAQYRSYRDVSKNNADVLFLGGNSAIAGRRFKSIGHASYFCVPRGAGMLYFLPCLLRYRRRCALTKIGSVDLPDGSSWNIYKNTNKKFVRGPRFWLDTSGSLELDLTIFSNLDYLVMRWFDQLPNWKSLQDLDLLVSDEHAKQLTDAADKKIGLFPIDVFSESGISSHEYRGISYFPPQLARRLLSQRLIGDQGVQIPDLRDAFFSFGYHLLFHKGPENKPQDNQLCETTWLKTHYYEELCRLADNAGIPMPQSLPALVDDLREEDWLPPMDTISVHAKHNDWLQEHFFSRDSDFGAGLSVLIVRDFAASDKMLTEIKEMLEAAGFSVLDTMPLLGARKERAMLQIRGGNWTSLATGPDMGLPAFAIVASDGQPRPVRGRRDKRRYPRVDNERVLVKNRIREHFRKSLLLKTCNLIHASDNTLEALEYLEVLDHPLLESLRKIFRTKH